MTFIGACKSTGAAVRFGDGVVVLISERNPYHSRPWQVIVEELSRETDPKKVFTLSAELNQALYEQGKGRPRRPRADSNGRKAG